MISIPSGHLRAPGLLAVPAVLAALALTAPAASAAVETFKLDTAHSTVAFNIRHLLSRVNGRFDRFSGTVTLDRTELARAIVQIEIDPSSISTNTQRRDDDLRSANFFDVARFPQMTFKSTRVTMRDSTSGTLTGDLTMHGVTKPVTLEFTVGGFMPGPLGSAVAGFSAHGTLDRKDFGIVWNRVLDQGGTLLGDDVNLVLEVEARVPPTQKPPGETAAAGPAETAPSATAAPPPPVAPKPAGGK